MARPNVQFKLIDESFVVPPSEAASTTIGAVFNPSQALYFLGNTAEKDAGYFYVPNLNSLFGKVSDYVIKLAGGNEALAGVTLWTVGSCAASIINGDHEPAGHTDIKAFRSEFWPIHNFLQYGGGCYVGFETPIKATYSDEFANLGFDVIFQGGATLASYGGSLYSTPLISIVEARASNDLPVIGVVNVQSRTADMSSQISGWTDYAGTNQGPPSGTNNYNYVRVYGEKLHINSVGDPTVLIATPLAADVAGCIVRTDRDAFPWFSPAGAKRGRILNSVRLNRPLSSNDQDLLYDANVNPVVTFPGEGTLLFGDKTGENETSTLSRINVSRLFMYVRKALGPVARAVLFEQNDSVTRQRFRIAASAFLDKIVGQRGISDYKVICDESNNGPEIVEANYFVADVLIKPITSINYVRITLTNKDLSDTL
jgi:hypothetical protein